MYDYIVYTDGGYSQKNNEGAFAYVMLDGDDVIKTRKCKRVNETNNRMEMKAIIAAIYDSPNDSTLLVRSDSQYAIGVLSGAWEGSSNLDLINLYRKYVQEKRLEVSFEWVKGHNGDRYNELCDMMCNDAVGYDIEAEFAIYRKKRDAQWGEVYSLFADMGASDIKIRKTPTRD